MSNLSARVAAEYSGVFQLLTLWCSERLICSRMVRAWMTECHNFSANNLVACSLSYLSLVFSALIIRAPPRHHQDTNMPAVVNHRQHSCLGLCLGTPHSNTRDELEIHLHTRNLTVVLDWRVPITSPSGLDTNFTPRSSWQVSQVVSLYHGPAWRVLRASQWNRTRVFSLNNFRVQVTGLFDV